ncbi:MAG: O-antigen ligase family protein [Alphaproteobacteria bacterium]|nr:O-antigen ligase family protein [Alphaproteobacteria bacterium]
MTNLKLQINNIKKIYIISFVIYLLLSRSVLFVNIISLPINSLIYNFFAISGFLLLALDVLLNFTIFKSKDNIILLIFLGICALSSLLNISYGLTNNLKTLVWTSIQFFILFSYVHIKDKTEVKNLINIIMKITCGVWFVAVAISLFQFIFQIHYRAPFAEFSRRQGFVDSRLFGIFSDPNFAAVTSLLVIVFCYILLKDCNNKLTKKYYVTNIIFQILYVILSGSRTAKVEGVMLAFILVYFVDRNQKYSLSMTRVKRKAFVKGVLAALISLLLINVLPTPLLKIAEVGNNIKISIFGEEDNDKDDDSLTLERDDVSEEDLSNNRSDIWKSSLEISAQKRLLGLSPRNMVPYATTVFPDSYIAQTGYETHNGYLAVFVGTGIIGFLVMLALAIKVVYHVCMYVKTHRRQVYDSYLILFFCCIFVIAVSTFMLLDIFFVNTYSAAIFWLFLGNFYIY